MAADATDVFVDDPMHISQRPIDTGKRRRRISKGDCVGPVTDMRLLGELLLFLCEHPPPEQGPHLPGKPHLPDTMFRAVDLKTGQRAWQMHGAIYAPIAAAGRDAYVVDGRNPTALDVTDGMSRWTVPTTGALRIGPVIAGDNLVTIAEDGTARMHSRATGKLVWKHFQLRGRLFAPPAVGEDLVFFPLSSFSENDAATGRLIALNRKSALMVWQMSLPGEALFFTPTIHAGRVLLPTMGDGDAPGHLYAFDEKTGEVMWKVEISADANGHDFTPVVSGDQVIIWSGSVAERKKLAVSLQYGLMSFDLTTGALRRTHWLTDGSKLMLSRPVVRGDRIVYGDGRWLRALKRNANPPHRRQCGWGLQSAPRRP